MIRMCAVAAVGVALMQPLSGYAAEAPKTPHQIISALQQRLYVIGETTGSLTAFAEAEVQAASQISSFANENSDPSALTEKDKAGMTPLIKASYLGYAEVTDALLKNSAVAASINEVDGKGVSAWGYSNFAIRQSILACNPGVMQNPFAWVPIMVTLPYYLAKDPYPKVRDALAKAGAAADMEKVKSQWLAICAQQTELTKAKVSAAADLMDAVIKEGSASMAAAMQQKQ